MLEPEVALIGNPNSGKSTLFNRLTGANQHIGNWPGVTVERISGECKLDEQQINVVDLPGTYALGDDNADYSIDERIAQAAVSDGSSDLYLNIVDATNLGRHLFLTSQLCERGVNMILVLNMADVAAKRKIPINTAALAQALGCPVIAISANTGEGIDALKQLVAERLAGPTEKLATAPFSLLTNITSA